MVGKVDSPWPFRPFRTPPFQHPRPPLHAQKPPPCKVTGTGHWLLQARASILLGWRESDPGHATNTEHTARFPAGQEKPPPLFLGPASAPRPGPCLNNFRAQPSAAVQRPPRPRPLPLSATVQYPYHYLRVAIHLHLRIFDLIDLRPGPPIDVSCFPASEGIHSIASRLYLPARALTCFGSIAPS